MATIDLKLKSYDELQFEIMRLNTDNYLKQQKIDQLTNNWNELEEWLKERIKWNKSILNEDKGNADLLGFNFNREMYIKIWEEILDKMKEIKEKNDSIQ